MDAVESTRLPGDVAASVKRTASDLKQAAVALDTSESSARLRDVTEPPSLTGTLRKTGIALALAPEPITTVAGVGLVVASFAVGRREPAGLTDLKEASEGALSALGAAAEDISSIPLG